MLFIDNYGSEEPKRGFGHSAKRKMRKAKRNFEDAINGDPNEVSRTRVGFRAVRGALGTVFCSVAALTLTLVAVDMMASQPSEVMTIAAVAAGAFGTAIGAYFSAKSVKMHGGKYLKMLKRKQKYTTDNIDLV